MTIEKNQENAFVLKLNKKSSPRGYVLLQISNIPVIFHLHKSFIVCVVRYPKLTFRLDASSHTLKEKAHAACRQ